MAEVVFVCEHCSFERDEADVECKGCRGKCDYLVNEKRCGKKCNFNFEQFDVGRRCSKHREAGMVNLLSKEMCEKRFRKRIESSGGKVVGEYKASNTPVDCICKEGHRCSPRPDNIQQGKGMCCICVSETAKREFYERIESLEGKVVGEYKTASIPVDCICKEGHQCSPTPNNIQQEQGMCCICAKRDSEKAKREFYERIESLEGKVVGEYKGSKIPVDCICKEGHRCSPTPTSIQQGNGMCCICVFETAKREFYERIESLEGKVVGEYKGSKIPVDCICKEGHRCSPTPTSIQQGKGMCGECQDSGGVVLLQISLENIQKELKIDLQIKREHIPDQLKPLRYDRFITYNSKSVFIEYHGIQHEKFIPFFHDDKEENFLQDRQRDLVKVHFVKTFGPSLNLRLIILDHTWSRKSLSSFTSDLQALLDSPDLVVAPSSLHTWIHDPPSQKTIDNYIFIRK